MVAPSHGIRVCLVCPAPTPGGTPRHPGFGVGMPMPGACPAGYPSNRPPPPPPVQKPVKRGDRYAPVDTARLDLGDHRATLTPPGGTPLVIATPMVVKTTYDKARVGLVLVPSAPGAQQHKDADWKGWSATWVSYVRALQPVRPTGFKVLGVRAQAQRDWIVPRLTGEWPARTASVTRVFSLIPRDLRAAQEATNSSALDASPQDKPTPAELSTGPEDHGPSPSQN